MTTLVQTSAAQSVVEALASLVAVHRLLGKHLITFCKSDLDVEIGRIGARKALEVIDGGSQDLFGPDPRADLTVNCSPVEVSVCKRDAECGVIAAAGGEVVVVGQSERQQFLP